MNTNISTINKRSSTYWVCGAVGELQQMVAGGSSPPMLSVYCWTNQPALNAAIERVRGREQGRGFCRGCADEVRTGTKTTQSTSEIEIYDRQPAIKARKQQATSSKAAWAIWTCQLNRPQVQIVRWKRFQALILEISHMSTHISPGGGWTSETSGDIAFCNIEDINHIADKDCKLCRRLLKQTKT